MIKICDKCRKEFNTTAPRQRFCNNPCNKKLNPIEAWLAAKPREIPKKPKVWVGGSYRKKEED